MKKLDRKANYYKIAIEAFDNGKNIINTLVDNGASKSESIELAYEIQAGEYTRNFDELNLRRNKEIHKIINDFKKDKDIREICVFGIGEAKNWIAYEGEITKLYGLELSYSRLTFANRNLKKLKGIKNFELFKGDASQKIFKNNSFDLSVTLHSIEPNGNIQGAKILKNVIDSSSKYIFLFEPDYLTANSEMRERMKNHDYVRNISTELKNYNSIKIIDKFNLKVQESNNNLTTCWIIEKKIKINTEKNKFICPYSSNDLTQYNDVLYSNNTGIGYPIIKGFKFLNKDDAIFIGYMDKEL